MSASPDSTHAALFGDERTLSSEVHPTATPSISSDSSENDTARCSHIASVFSNPSAKTGITNKYRTVIAWYAQRTHDALHSTKRRKVSSPTCNTCNQTLPRPFVCLHCTFSGCWLGGHITNHMTEAGHSFCSCFPSPELSNSLVFSCSGVDVKSGLVFCSECNDFILDDTIDDLHLSTVVSTEERNTKFQVENRGREPYQPWTPTEEEFEALKDANTLPCSGRRGLLNLGQTCFLNVILQSFIHNPLLRNYFLSDRHNSKECKQKEIKLVDCTCCEMDNLFTEIYSPTNTPFGPTSFLATTWKVSPAEMSGYAQQDAHEFFIAALNQIHNTSRGRTNISCNCIIHQTFAGQFQSDVTCEKCGNVTSTVDPMLDISLELRARSGETAPDNTLASCLRRYTKQEKLGAREYTCSKCTKASHEAVKRLSIRTLPPVLSFQFKRFEHKTSGKAAPQKIDVPVRIPASINMAPYTTLAMNNKDAESGVPGPDAMYEYDLFAVINHEGQMDNGHYTNFARFQDEWYRFDDDKVTPSTLGDCLASNVYMCFYVKRHLDYKPFMKPTYRVTREKDIVREQEMEREKEAARQKEVEDSIMAIV